MKIYITSVFKHNVYAQSKHSLIVKQVKQHTLEALPRTSCETVQKISSNHFPDPTIAGLEINIG